LRETKIIIFFGGFGGQKLKI
jgi:hypothetical protein